MIHTLRLNGFALAAVLLLPPIPVLAQAIVLIASNAPVISFNAQLERLNFHTSCSSIDNAAAGAREGNGATLTAVLTRADGSELGRVENIECAGERGFSSLDIRADLNAAGEATIFVNDLPQGSLATDRGRVTMRLTMLCDRPCPQGVPFALDGAVISRDSGETRGYLRWELERVQISSYQTSGSGD
jgi:hypothetical protein